MATAQDILRVAAGEIGYVALNDPESGSKYGRAYAKLVGNSYFAGPSTQVPWCAMFVSWVFNQCGMTFPGYPTASCSVIVRNARGTSYEVKNIRDAQPGDIILFDWNPSGGDGADHVGIVEKNCGNYVQTIEGNTSSGNSGSQSNGGGVWRRTRAWSTVYMIVRPAYGAPVVVKKNMNDAQIADIPNQTYTGGEVKPAVTSGAGATFNVAYSNNINVGYGTATATGTGNWEGSVSKQFKILPASLVKYTDVDPDAWYVDGLSRAVQAGYIFGYGDNVIAPNDALTRGQACCLFANMEGVQLGAVFSDVVASPYYYEAVNWAEKNGIVNGDGGIFRPDDPCTRQEFCVMLHNLAGNPQTIMEPTGLNDWNMVADWAKDAVSWCVEKGIMSGDSGFIRPNDNCLRCEAASLLVNYKDVI